MATNPRVNTPQNYVFGRPAKYDLKEEARLLLEWAKKDDSLELIDFANERNFVSQNFNEWDKQDDDFSFSLKKAKDLIATRRTKLVNKGIYNYGVYNRYQFMYDSMLRGEERDEKAYEASLRTKVDDTNRVLDAQAIAKACKEMDERKSE